MDDLAKRVARLEAEAEIRKLKARYLNACDAKDVEAIRDCFIAEGARIEYPPIGAFDDREGLIEIFTQLAATTPIVDVHQGHNAEITIIDDDHAEGRWSLSFFTYDPRTRGFRLLSSFYTDRYVRTADGWRIAFSRSDPRTVIDGIVTEDKLIQADWVPIGS